MPQNKNEENNDYWNFLTLENSNNHYFLHSYFGAYIYIIMGYISDFLLSEALPCSFDRRATVALF